MMDLSNLRGLLGDEAMVGRFIELFRREAPLQLEALRQSLLAGEWASAGIAAHGLKSQLRYLGVASAADLASGIEEMAEAGTDPGDRFAALESAVDEVLAALP